MPTPSPRTLRRALPAGVAVAVAAAVAVPSIASGADAPRLPARSAAQLLAAVEQTDVQALSGTVVSTARLGLPALPSASTSGGSADALGMLTGSHTLRVWVDGDQRQRLALLDSQAETDVVHSGRQLWTFASATGAVSHTSLPAERAGERPAAPEAALTPQQAAEKALAAIDPSTAVTVDRTAKVAGRSAYQLVLTPRDASSLVGSVRIAIDSATSLPLRLQVWQRGVGLSGLPAYQVGFSDLSLSTPAASTFAFTPPRGSTVTEHTLDGTTPGEHLGTAPRGTASYVPEQPTVVGSGWSAVAVVRGLDLTGKTGSTLQEASTPVAGGGRLVTSALVSVLVRGSTAYIGAVTPQRLQQVADSTS